MVMVKLMKYSKVSTLFLVNKTSVIFGKSCRDASFPSFMTLPLLVPIATTLLWVNSRTLSTYTTLILLKIFSPYIHLESSFTYLVLHFWEGKTVFESTLGIHLRFLQRTWDSPSIYICLTLVPRQWLDDKC